MKNIYVITSLVALFVGSIAFYGGMKYQQSQRTQFQGMMGNRIGDNQRGGMGQGGSNRANQGFRPVSGEIISTDDKSITVKLNDGSSKIVLISENTQINKAQKVEKSDLKTGEKVAVFGNENNDGSVTAQNVQLNPEFRMFGGRVSPSP